ncbi:hypothetical protein B484DRAFT_437587, partial [Ochromonadaceae sp. CCMP2298]
PSGQPSGRPSGQPIAQPSGQPSAQPSNSPLIFGVTRTSRPTKQPTSQPTSSPTGLPTSSPSLSSETQWSAALSDLLEGLSDSLHRGAQITSFSDLLLSNALVFGGTAAFANYRADLATVEQFNSIQSIQLFHTSSLYQTPLFGNTTCAHPATASAIVRRLVDSRSFDNVYLSSEYTCQGSTWVVHNCPESSSVKLCVDCFDPCLFSNVNSRTVFPHNCESTNCLHSLVLSSVEPFPPAQIGNLSIDSRSTSTIEVSLQTSEFAFVYCKAFRSTVPSTVDEVLLENRVNATQNNKVRFLFSDLAPASNYSIYCVTVSSSGSTLGYAAMLAAVAQTATRCCKVVTVTLVEMLYSADYSNQQALSIVVDSAPLLNVSLALAHSMPNSLNSPNSLTAPATSRCTFSPQISLEATSVVGQAVAVAVRCGADVATGTYTLQAVLSGASSAQYEVRFASGQSFQVVDSSTTVTLKPSLVAAVFAKNGGTFDVTFSTATNKALLPDAFGCSLLLSFTGAGNAQCLWTSSRSIRVTQFGAARVGLLSAVTLGSGTATVTVQRLKAICPLVSCGALPAINPADKVYIAAPAAPLIPLVNLVAPSRIGHCQPLHLDLSSSSGSAGRPWVSAVSR